MPRMFDILRGKEEKPDEDAEKVEEKDEKKDIDIPPSKSPEPPVSFPKQDMMTKIEDEKKPEDHSLVSKKLIAEVRKHGVDNQEKAKDIYEKAVETLKTLLVKIRTREDLSVYMDKLYGLLDDLFNQLVLGDSILTNIYDDRVEEYYLPHHIVNVVILSSIIGLNMGFNKALLSHIGLSSIFHDVGMDALREIAAQSRKLTDEEHGLVKTHIQNSLAVVDRVGTFSEVVKETIRQHHERIDGSGYPKGMKADKINAYAKILALADTYEAITHKRPHRAALNAHNAVRFLLGSLKNNFDSGVIKLFINKMSVYPVGSIVILETDEIARVISVQPGSPLRPVVMILRDADGEPVKQSSVIDLSRQDFPSIKGSI